MAIQRQLSKKEAGDKGASYSDVSPKSNTPSGLQFFRNESLKISDQTLLNGILEKSSRAMSANSELSRKLAENEEAIKELGSDIKTLQKRVSQQILAADEVEALRQKLLQMADLNMSLKQDLEIVKQDASQRDRHITILKRAVIARKSPAVFRQERQDEINNLSREKSELLENISLLKQDLQHSRQEMDILKRRLASKQVFLTKEILARKNSQIRILEASLIQREKEGAELRAKLEKISKINIDDYEHLKTENAGLKDENKRAAEELSIKTKDLEVLKQEFVKIRLHSEKLGELSKSLVAMKSKAESATKEKEKAILACKALAAKLQKSDSSLSIARLEAGRLANELSEVKGKAGLALDAHKLESIRLKELESKNQKLLLLLLELRKKFSLNAKSHSSELQRYKGMMKDASELMDKYQGHLSRFKKSLAHVLRSRVISEAEKHKLKAKLVELTKARQEMAAREIAHKRMIIELTKREIEAKGELEIIKNRQ